MPEPQQVKDALARVEPVGEAWVYVPVEDAPAGQPPVRRALNLVGLASILGVASTSVVQFRAWSKSGRLPAGTPPFPAEDGRMFRSPYWWPERVGEILDWQAARPGRGAGGGAGKHQKRTGAAAPAKPAKQTRAPAPGMPRFQQVAEDLRNQIAHGKLAPGDRLPSVATLADKHGVSTTTVQQALVYLRGQGAITSERGRGNFVAEPPPAAKKPAKKK